MLRVNLICVTAYLICVTASKLDQYLIKSWLNLGKISVFAHLARSPAYYGGVQCLMVFSHTCHTCYVPHKNKYGSFYLKTSSYAVVQRITGETEPDTPDFEPYALPLGFPNVLVSVSYEKLSCSRNEIQNHWVINGVMELCNGQ